MEDSSCGNHLQNACGLEYAINYCGTHRSLGLVDKFTLTWMWTASMHTNFKGGRQLSDGGGFPLLAPM